MEFLVSANPEKRGHYFSYLAFAHARLKDYPTALYYLSFYDADDPIYATNKDEIEWVVEFKVSFTLNSNHVASFDRDYAHFVAEISSSEVEETRNSRSGRCRHFSRSS